MSGLRAKSLGKLIVVLSLFFLLPVHAEEIKRVVWHVDYGDPARLGRMITSINNMTQTWEGDLIDYDIRVVFLGAGIRFLTSDKLKNSAFKEDRKLRKARQQINNRLQSLNNVKLELCGITANAVQLNKATLLPGVTLVPSGVVEIADLQAQGYSYLKAD